MERHLLCRITLVVLVSALRVDSGDLPLDEETPTSKAPNRVGYLFTMPQTLRAGSEERYCLTLNGYNEEGVLRLTFKKLQFSKKDEFYDTVFNNDGECVKFKAPQEPGQYTLQLSSTTHPINNSVEVEVKGNNLITFVQSDKPIYKPGETVKFRILTMTRDLKARTGKIEYVLIKDPFDLRVKQYKDVETEGMANLEFQLAKEPRLGVWTIEVSIDQEQTKQTFKVEEYVLPRFEVKINPPSYILANAEFIKGSVCAKYTYGKPVKGFLNLKICSSSRSREEDCRVVLSQIDGCYQFSVSVSSVWPPKNDYYYYGRYSYHYASKFIFKASVAELNTGVTVNASTDGPAITSEYRKITFPSTSRYFKPGLPVLGKIRVEKPDGTPAAGEEIVVTARDYNTNFRQQKNFTTDDSGELVYTICQGLAEKTSSVSVTATLANFEEDSNSRIHKPSGYTDLQQWFSPSLSYIQLPPLERTLHCGTNLRLNVPYTHSGSAPWIKFHYQVMSRGQIVFSGIHVSPTIPAPVSDLEISMDSCLEIEPTLTNPPPTKSDSDSTPLPVTEEVIIPEVAVPLESDDEDDWSEIRRKRSPDYFRYGEYGSFKEEEIVRSNSIADEVSTVQLQIQVTPEMSPKFTLLLYYVREDGETVADSMEYRVEPCFKNNVRMGFSVENILPGAETQIRVEAAPGSVCGLGVVDKSVNILGGDHQITSQKVFDKLAEYSLSSRHNSYYFRPDDKYCEDKMSKQDGHDETMEPYFGRYWDYSSSYVDAIEAFKRMGVITLTDLVLETRPCKRRHPVQYGHRTKLLTVAFTESVLPGMGAVLGLPNRLSPDPSSAVLRSYFPETWLWDILLVGEEGFVEAKHTAPHTVTKWIGNSLCINAEAGFGLSPLASLTTFQPFFLSFNLPYAAVRGERLPVTVTVYNYLEKCLHMLLSVDGFKKFKIFNPRGNREPFCLCGGQSHTKKFYITAQDIGKLPIFGQAEIIPGQCGNEVSMDTQYIGLTDSVQRDVLVKAEGVSQHYSNGMFLCPSDNKPVKKNVLLPLPADIVKDSARGEVAIIGDIMGPSLSNLDHLVKMPTGCGEQNMIGFTPNIYVLKYLKATGQLTPEIEQKTKSFMEIGYQRELQYRHSDGSFSAFGPVIGTQGSTWLTAFVVKSFAQAKPYIFIDEKDLNISISFLKKSQMESGCFLERGKVLQSYMQGGLGQKREGDDRTLTAYVLIAILQAGLNKEDPVVRNAIECINRQQQLDPETDVYTLSLVAYANTLFDESSHQSREILNTLEEKAVIEGNIKYWKREGEPPKPVNTWYYSSAPSAEVEMTAYALLAVLRFYGSENVAHGQPIVSWISKQQNSFGGFSSTQDTVVGLNGLSEFALLAYSKDATNLTITLHGSGIKGKTVEVNSENSLQLQTVPLTKLNTTLLVEVIGRGCVLIQANVHFNKRPRKLGINDPKFFLQVHARPYQHNKNKCDRRTLHISFGVKNSEDYTPGMIILAVRMVTGWQATPESLQELRTKSLILGIDKVEVDEEEGIVNFYLDGLDLSTKHITLEVEQDQVLKVSAPKPADVQIYQYYETDVKVVQSYSIKTTCGTKEEIPDVLPDDSAQPFPVQRRLSLENSIPFFAADTQSSSPALSCPVCNHTVLPKSFATLLCNFTAVYKADAGRTGKFSLKIKENLGRQTKEGKINQFANAALSKGCICPELDSPPHDVIILTRADNLVDLELTLDSETYVFKLSVDRRLEKKAIDARKRCNIK